MHLEYTILEYIDKLPIIILGSFALAAVAMLPTILERGVIFLLPAFIVAFIFLSIKFFIVYTFSDSMDVYYNISFSLYTSKPISIRNIFAAIVNIIKFCPAALSFLISLLILYPLNLPLICFPFLIKLESYELEDVEKRYGRVGVLSLLTLLILLPIFARSEIARSVISTAIISSIIPLSVTKGSDVYAYSEAYYVWRYIGTLPFILLASLLILAYLLSASVGWSYFFSVVSFLAIAFLMKR